ncbi:MAG TPA: hypothetical protein VEU47_06155 [Candidatus Cybelea sp.]|nr:hypothetical protein [Candidatus Cybelea sp.]
MARCLFDRVIVVDWSAASRPGPERESHDRCWLAWGGPRTSSKPLYFRTRADAERRIAALIGDTQGNVLVGFDFPFGYPIGSKLGGGRALAAKLHGLIEDAPDGRNNRFEVAARLNIELGAPPGPFWGCTYGNASAALRPTKPAYDGRAFAERRIADGTLRHRQIMPVWQLLGRGAVGGQMLLGLPAVHRLLQRFGARARVWPFETGWDDDLEGIVIAEMWPSLNDHDRQRHPIKDARQVSATRDWLLKSDGSGELRRHLARPDALTAAQLEVCQTEEGWIVGAEAAASSRRKLA